MKNYLHQLPGWPKMTWDYESLAVSLASVSLHQGRILGVMQNLGFGFRERTNLDSITKDITESSAIEGENLNLQQVRSSVAKRLGMDIGVAVPEDRDVDGIVDMMLDATQNYNKPLTSDRLFEWHTRLFPDPQPHFGAILVGQWRKGPMQVVSGAIGREKVQFEAPEADLMPGEMACFLDWYNSDTPIVPILKAALAHLWFVTIHPFDDGNGRIARAIADMSLARADGTSQRFYSMSAQIRKETSSYYRALEETQEETLDITIWMRWFLDCLERAMETSDRTVELVLRQDKFWRQYDSATFNERQRHMIKLLFDGFEGNLNAAKWAKITKTSPDSALRDISELLRIGILQKGASGGRSTSYFLIEP